MKKTLAAVAVLGAFAGSALAADVTLYGMIDTGLAYTHVDLDNAKGGVDKLSMESGMQSGSRFGFKGTEDLGNGLTVGFILENQFSGDDGALKDGLLFRREASLFLQGGFGKIAAGRMGSINNGTSSWGKLGMTSAFGTSGWGGYAAQAETTFSAAGLWDNMISYETPSFAGFKVYAQYGMGGQSYTYENDQEEDVSVTGVENESSSNRYYAIGATYNNGPVAAYFAVDSINYKSFYAVDGSAGATAHDTDDSLTITLGGSYDFEVAKVFFGAQYFDEVAAFGNLVTKTSFGSKKITGYGLTVSANIPVAGGNILAGVNYVDAEAADSLEKTPYKDDEFQRYTVTVGYDYPLSKRTDVYTVASYMQDDVTVAKKDIDTSAYSLVVGLRHKF
ncbi:MAG: porin [Sutterellaceae bacterium]|nr:porin [Sutterellaceae bacterium]